MWDLPKDELLLEPRLGLGGPHMFLHASFWCLDIVGPVSRWYCWWGLLAVEWCSGEVQGFSFPHVSKKIACLISLSFVQCVRKRKGQAGRGGRKVNHDKMSPAFWCLSLHTASLLLSAWLSALCWQHTGWTWGTSGSGFPWLTVLTFLLFVLTSILWVVNWTPMVQSQGCSVHPWGRFLGGRGEVFQVPLGLSEYDLVHFKDRKNHLSPGQSPC